MNFSSVSSRSVLGKALRLPLTLIPQGAVLPVLQGALRGKRWIAGSSSHGCWLGSYEYEKSRLFTSYIRGGNVVFDVGANVGYYSLLAAQAVGPTGHVVAFEPLPQNIAYVRRHVILNGVLNIEIIESAVSDQDGTAWFSAGQGSSMGSISALASGLRVEMVSIDRLVTEGAILPPDVMKIDVEGSEGEVLRGAEWSLKEYHPVIFVATHGPIVHRISCDFLTGLGYDLRSVMGRNIETTDEIVAVYAQ